MCQSFVLFVVSNIIITLENNINYIKYIAKMTAYTFAFREWSRIVHIPILLNIISSMRINVVIIYYDVNGLWYRRRDLIRSQRHQSTCWMCNSIRQCVLAAVCCSNWSDKYIYFKITYLGSALSHWKCVKIKPTSLLEHIHYRAA